MTPESTDRKIETTAGPGRPSGLRVTLAQMRPTKARPDANLAAVRQTVATAESTDLIVFPETVLTGYFIEGGVLEGARSADEIAAGLGPAREGAPDVVLGFYERWRNGLYNAAAYFENSAGQYRVRHVHRKLFLPTYGLFDEARFVSAGRQVRAFDTRFGRLGLLICEDLWHSLPATILALDGAELVIVTSAAPARDFSRRAAGLPLGDLDSRGMAAPGNVARWHRLARSTAEEHGVFVAVSQLVGSEGGKLLSGASVVVAPDGQTLATGPLFDEALVHAEIHGRALERARAGAPLLTDLEQQLPALRSELTRAASNPVEPTTTEQRPALPRGHAGPLRPDDPDLLALDLEHVEQALVHFIREEVRVRRNFQRVVIGVSGGVDSAVSLALACRALGPENVYGIRMPYATSSPDSLDHAREAFEQTGAHEQTIDITAAVDGYLTNFEDDADGLRRGNVMARMRMIVLFDQSAKLRALPLGTGNKSERLLGYYTWHADDAPPINPLGDLFKTQVWALARHLAVPQAIVDKPASADLVRGVHDEDELGIAYHRADPILHWLLRGCTPAELIECGFDAREVDVVHRRLEGTHWKRELPTVALLSSTAIGEFYLRPVDY